MDDMLTMGRQVLALQPFSVLLGAELTGFSEGSAELKVPIRERAQTATWIFARWSNQLRRGQCAHLRGRQCFRSGRGHIRIQNQLYATGNGRLHYCAGHSHSRWEKSSCMPL